MKKRKPMSNETKIKIGLANKGVWIKYNCDNCGKQKEEKQSHYKKKNRHFCSMRCYAKYRETKMQPHEQNTWKGGVTKQNQRGRGTRRYRKWRESVLKRDNYKCIVCGTNENLEADHIKSWLSFVDLRYEIDNGRTLCVKHHNRKRKYENPDLIPKTAIG